MLGFRCPGGWDAHGDTACQRGAGRPELKPPGQGLYHEVIQELDHGVGRILDRLRELEIADRTLVIFTSDNGPSYGGSIVDVSCHETTLSFTVEETGHFQNFITREIGRLEFRNPGVYTLSVRPRTKAANAVMDLRQIALRPVR